MSLLRPRTIRGQLIVALILLETLLVLVFSALAIHEHYVEVEERAVRRMEYQASRLAADASYSLEDQRPERLAKSLAQIAATPSMIGGQVTDLEGRTIASSIPSLNGKFNLSAAEKTQPKPLDRVLIFDGGSGHREALAPVKLEDRTVGYVWIYPNDAADQRDLRALLFLTLLYMVTGTLACTLLATVVARSITRPLKLLLEATRHLVQHPEDTSAFPLTLATANEAADLATGLNLMVASIEEQRAGLNDTLALLDSMLANAPIGFAFFDRKYRLVRINQFLADLNQLSISLQLGRTVAEFMPPSTAAVMQRSIEAVFETGAPVRDLDLSADVSSTGAAAGGRDRFSVTEKSWLANLYPVKTGAQTVRWVGAIIVDTTERKRSEDALRKTEKLAAAGRLAASIAHEINNPLEAVTNLLYLLRNHANLDAQALGYAELAQHEVARVSEITQQTLRFYRQSTLPVVSTVSDLLDSVVTLHQGRVSGLQIEIVRKYEPDVELFCFAGELRQLFANLVGNALDSMQHGGGRLTLCVRRSRSWAGEPVEGVRVVVADTGSGMDEEVRRRIFEPFFTTKEVTGTGLGLWVSAEIIQKHGGAVRVRSRPSSVSPMGSGSVFMVFFPQVAAVSAAGRELAAKAGGTMRA